MSRDTSGETVPPSSDDGMTARGLVVVVRKNWTEVQGQTSQIEVSQRGKIANRRDRRAAWRYIDPPLAPPSLPQTW
jgi:hypothetical protein